MANDEAHDQERADQARVAAEARRKRILENASKRNGLVSGEIAVDDETKEESQKNAARIRAARQRRYGKKKMAAVVTAETPAAANAATDDDGEDTTKAAAVVEEPAKMEEQLKEEEPKKEEPIKAVAAAAAAVVEEPKAAEVVEDNTDTKKYMGVAKMRRKKMLERKQQQSQGDDATAKSTTAAVVLPPKPMTQKILVVPIYMHIFTIVLLFLAGVDIAFQPFQETVIVSNDHTVSQYGIPLIHRSLSYPLAALDNQKDRLLDDDLHNLYGEQEDIADEFQKVPEHGYVPNIDPLFRIDLDEYTKGSGIISTLGRGAVRVHRFTLQMVWYTPLSLVYSIVGIPQALMETPPLLCVVALTLRQVVGKAILGANIVAAPEEKVDSTIDIVNMAKKFVTNFLSTSFPTAISIWDAVSHLRQDMYVILCGVFCGLAWNHLFHYEYDDNYEASSSMPHTEL
jgi:hypothetical protein